MLLKSGGNRDNVSAENGNMSYSILKLLVFISRCGIISALVMFNLRFK